MTSATLENLRMRRCPPIGSGDIGIGDIGSASATVSPPASSSAAASSSSSSSSVSVALASAAATNPAETPVPQALPLIAATTRRPLPGTPARSAMPPGTTPCTATAAPPPPPRTTAKLTPKGTEAPAARLSTVVTVAAGSGPGPLALRPPRPARPAALGADTTAALPPAPPPSTGGQLEQRPMR